MLRASFKTRVFEKGGDASVDRILIPYSPYRSYVGFDMPEHLHHDFLKQLIIIRLISFAQLTLH